MLRRRRLQAAAAAVVDDDDDDGVMAYALSRHRARLASAIDLPETLSEYIEEVRPWCGQPSDRGRLKIRSDQRKCFSGTTENSRSWQSSQLLLLQSCPWVGLGWVYHSKC